MVTADEKAYLKSHGFEPTADARTFVNNAWSIRKMGIEWVMCYKIKINGTGIPTNSDYSIYLSGDELPNVQKHVKQKLLKAVDSVIKQAEEAING